MTYQISPKGGTEIDREPVLYFPALNSSDRQEELTKMAAHERPGVRLRNRVSAVCLLLDSATRNSIGQQEIHLRLCRILKAQGIRVVLVYAEGVSPEVVNKFREAGADIEIIGYG